VRRAAILAALFAAGCASDMRSRGPAFFADNLRDIHTWDPQRAAEGQFPYDIMMPPNSEPRDSVPVLILKLADTSPTSINDRIREAPTVGHVAFHILLRIFAMKAEQFEPEGVWVMTSEPSKNPIYMVKFRDEGTRERLAHRFRELATQRGWF
jgi:hypothetical protein